MDQLIKHVLGNVADTANAAGHIVHHTGKPKLGQVETKTVVVLPPSGMRCATCGSSIS